MILLNGVVQKGAGHFKPRFEKFGEVFSKATGEKLYPGTLNVKVKALVTPIEHFRVIGAEIEEPEQDLLFEVCRINGIWAYRIRPYHLATGRGGWGDDTLEIACAQYIQDMTQDSLVEVELFRVSL
jgi:CTP-dependent riboflavin kinase